MGRYIPTYTEQKAIDRLRLAGFAVVRQGTYDNLRKRLDLAEWRLQGAGQQVEDSHRWAREQCDEARRLSDRLNAVVAAAAASGVSIHDINAALSAASTKEA